MGGRGGAQRPLWRLAAETMGARRQTLAERALARGRARVRSD
jgi:hypothetical protein